MSYDKDLLDKALFLATKEPKKPKQASLRRAVSSAYYSLFHFIIEGVSVQILKNDSVIRLTTNRKFEHKNLRDVSSRHRNSSNAEIASLAMTGHNLMDARHNADYNLYSKISRNDVLGYIDEVSLFKLTWKKLSKSNPPDPEFNAFVTELLFGKPR